MVLAPKIHFGFILLKTCEIGHTCAFERLGEGWQSLGGDDEEGDSGVGMLEVAG